MRILLVALLACTSLVGVRTTRGLDYTPRTPAEHRARFDYRRVEALFDTPLRDTAVTRAPDGTYYLTGTSGTRRADGSVDFNRNEGIYLWKSDDLQDWEPLGKVAGLDPDRGGTARPAAATHGRGRVGVRRAASAGTALRSGHLLVDLCPQATGHRPA